jgi:carbon storage regulator
VLILWRRSGQTLIVGEGVEIEVLDARHNRVKLGILAPRTVSIVRGESRITREENRVAALSAGHSVIETLLKRLSSKTAPTAVSSSHTRRQNPDDALTAKNPRTLITPPDMKQ